jgi:hypothetical protein
MEHPAGDLAHAAGDVAGVVLERVEAVAAAVDESADVTVAGLIHQSRQVVVEVAHGIHDRLEQNRQGDAGEHDDPEDQNRATQPSAPRQAPAHCVHHRGEDSDAEDGDQDEQQDVPDRRQRPSEGDRDPDEQDRPNRDEHRQLAPAQIVRRGRNCGAAHLSLDSEAAGRGDVPAVAYAPISARRSARMIRSAASISAMCENASAGARRRQDSLRPGRRSIRSRAAPQRDRTSSMTFSHWRRTS